jgi:hypothetical protein
MWMDEWTDMTKLIVAFHSFAKTPKSDIPIRNNGIGRG